jgi:membrane protease YdiL (CAAX protease family)
MAPVGQPPWKKRSIDGTGVFGLDPRAKPGDVPWGSRQFLLAALVATGPVVALWLLSLLLPSDYTEESADEIATAGSALFLVVFTLLTDGWFVLWSWFFSLRRPRLPLASWGLRSPGLRILWLVPATLVAVYILNTAYEVIYQLLAGSSTPQQEIVEMFPRDASGVVMFAFMAVVVAPLMEELVFRGFVFQAFAASFGVIPGVVASAAVFSVIHGQATVFVPLFVLGVALAWTFHATKSLWTPIALHAVFNGLSVLLWAVYP